MDIVFRNAKKEDIDRIQEIELVSFPPEEAATEGKYAWRQEHYPKYFFVAEVSGIVVAVVCAMPTSLDLLDDGIYELKTQPSGSNAAIISVMADPAYRKQGITGDLINYALTKIREYGMTKSALCCKEQLVHYYERFGYELVGMSKSNHGGAVWYDMVCEL